MVGKEWPWNCLWILASSMIERLFSGEDNSLKNDYMKIIEAS